MPIEIKQLEIKGVLFKKESVSAINSGNEDFVSALKREVVELCLEKLERYLENQKNR